MDSLSAEAMVNGTAPQHSSAAEPLAGDHPIASTPGETPSDERAGTGQGPDRLRVLLVGAGPEVRALFPEAFPEPEGELYLAETGREAENLMLHTPFALILVNLTLPDTDGRLLLDRLRQHPRTAATPIVMLLTDGTSHLERECRALGATACLPKPLDARLLGMAVADALAAARASDENAPSEEPTDPTPHLPTRAAFHEAFTHAKNQARSGQYPMVLALVRIDDFDALADAFGTDLTTPLLHRFESALNETFQPPDLCARWTTGEFAVLMMNAQRDRVHQTLAAFQHAISLEPLFLTGNHSLTPTATCGVVQVKEEASLKNVIIRANRLLAGARSMDPGTIVSDDDSGAFPRRTALLALPNDLLPAGIRHHLDVNGFDVLHCSSYDTALSTIARRPSFDLALVDVGLQRAHRRSIIEVLRANPVYATTPIIMVLVAGHDAALDAGFEQGATDYLVKPFSSTDVLNRLHYVLKQHYPTTMDHCHTPAPHDAPGLPSDPFVNALVQVIRTRLSEGKSVTLPHLGNLLVEFEHSTLNETEDGGAQLLPPRHTVRFVPS